MSDRIKMLRQRKVDLLNEATALTAKADAGTITEDESKRLDALIAVNGDVDKVNASIKVEERLMDERRTMPAAININDDTVHEAAARVPATVAAEGKVKFKSLGEQLQSIARAAMHKGVHYSEIDNRLIYQAGGAGANESTPSEGGFLVQQDFSMALFETMMSGGDILARVRRIPVSANSNGVILPALDETSRANGSRFGGVRGYWVDEGDSITASAPKFRHMDMRLKKVAAVGYATDELLADSTALEAVFSVAFPEELRFKVEDSVVNGTGSGQPLGILNSGGVVTVTPASGQAASSMTTQNILDMWIRMPARLRRNAVWLINQEIEQQLWQLVLGSGTGVMLLYTPPGQRGNNTDFGLLLGRPVIPVEYCSALGTAGDIILVDLNQYVMIDKQGIQQATSLHLRFLTDEAAFRATYRVDGQPVWRTTLQPFKGTATLSPYVILGIRNS